MRISRSDNPNDVYHTWREQVAVGKEGVERMDLARSWSAANQALCKGRFFMEHVDDDVNAGAMLLFITHEHQRDMNKPDAGSWHGVTVEYISQWKPHAEFFLYPGDLDGVLGRLTKLREQACLHASGREEHGVRPVRRAPAKKTAAKKKKRS